MELRHSKQILHSHFHMVVKDWTLTLSVTDLVGKVSGFSKTSLDLWRINPISNHYRKKKRSTFYWQDTGTCHGVRVKDGWSQKSMKHPAFLPLAQSAVFHFWPYPGEQLRDAGKVLSLSGLIFLTCKIGIWKHLPHSVIQWVRVWKTLGTVPGTHWVLSVLPDVIIHLILFLQTELHSFSRDWISDPNSQEKESDLSQQSREGPGFLFPRKTWESHSSFKCPHHLGRVPDLASHVQRQGLLPRAEGDMGGSWGDQCPWNTSVLRGQD